MSSQPFHRSLKLEQLRWIGGGAEQEEEHCIKDIVNYSYTRFCETDAQIDRHFDLAGLLILYWPFFIFQNCRSCFDVKVLWRYQLYLPLLFSFQISIFFTNKFIKENIWHLERQQWMIHHYILQNKMCILCTHFVQQVSFSYMYLHVCGVRAYTSFTSGSFFRIWLVFYFRQAKSKPECMETCSCYKVLTKTDVDEEDDDEDARSDEESLRVFL